VLCCWSYSTGLALWNKTGKTDHLSSDYSTGQATAGDNWEHVYLTQILPDKLRLDLEYIEQQSFLFDLAVLAQAALSLFKRNESSTGEQS